MSDPLFFYRDKWNKSWKKILNDPQSFANKSEKGHDQDILSKHIWTWAKTISLQHDSYL